MSSKSIIAEVEGRVEQLIADHKRLGALCQELKSERDILLQERRDLQEKVKEQHKQLSVLQLCEGLGASSGASSEARHRARARVNSLMREVDRCIAMLSATDGATDGATEIKE